MQFLLSHWHCILPIAGLGIAYFFMREKKPKDKEDIQDHSTGILEHKNQDESSI